MSDEILKLENEAMKAGQSVELSDGALDSVVGGDSNTGSFTQLTQAISNAMKMISDTSKNTIANIR